MVISDRRTNLKEWTRSIKGVDLIITTHAHFNDVRKIVGVHKWIFPLDLHLSYETMSELAKIRDTKIAVPFLRPATVRRLDHSIKAVGFHIDLVSIQHKEAQDLVRKIKGYRTVMVPPNHLMKIEQVIPRNVEIIAINTVLGEGSIQHLKQSVATIYPRPHPPILKKTPGHGGRSEETEHHHE
jgi:hypothetical protein